MTELSITMQAALMHATGNGGQLVRAPGGFWIREEDKAKVPHCQTYGTKTIEALVKRGAAEYTEWKEGRQGRFPVAIKVVRHD